MNLGDISAVYPLLAITITAMVVLLVDLVLPRDKKIIAVLLSLAGLIVTGYYVSGLWGLGMTAFNGSITGDDFSVLFQMILVFVAFLAILLSEKYVQTKGINHGEYYALLLFSTSGAMLMASSTELITIFIGLEVLSIALYILSGFARTEARSEESAMKYFLLGAFSSAFLLYGIALIYGATGTTRLDFIGTPAFGAVHSTVAALSSPYATAGVALLIVGLGFKAAIVPFHSWTPDVYEGAPTSVTAFMSAGAKAGAFAAFIRVVAAFLQVSHVFHDVLWVLAALTMVVGNVVAVQQTNIKRMLAYSSIAHAGYILVGLLAENTPGRTAVLFYILAYTFMNLGAFGVIILLARRGQELNNISDLKGLWRQQPALAVVMAIFMLSLGGIPPTIGFFGKLYLFLAAIQAGQNGLAYLGLLASVVGVFYYLRVIVSMFFEPAQREFPSDVWRFAPFATAAVVVCAFCSILFGILPSGLYEIADVGGSSILVLPQSVPHGPVPTAGPAQAHIWTPAPASTAPVAVVRVVTSGP
jgi:NADH-quinone oxidoreductase subunit N